MAPVDPKGLDALIKSAGLDEETAQKLRSANEEATPKDSDRKGFGHGAPALTTAPAVSI